MTRHDRLKHNQPYIHATIATKSLAKRTYSQNFSSLLLFSFFLFAFLLINSATNAQGRPPGSKIFAKHGHWQVICGRPVGAKLERCAAVQSVTAEDRPNVGLTVTFLKAANRSKKLLRVVAPLGVLLPTGLGLKIDDKDIGRVPFIKCGKIGCVADVVVSDDLATNLKKGSTAIFIIFQTPEAGIAIPISLTGFTAAFKAMR